MSETTLREIILNDFGLMLGFDLPEPSHELMALGFALGSLTCEQLHDHLIFLDLPCLH